MAIVSGHLGGAGGGSAATVAFSFSGATVTSGNTILCGVSKLTRVNATAGMLTKTAGTSTIGTVTMDQQSGSLLTAAIYKVPVTGTGTITLTWNPSATDYMFMGCAEFSGVNATPLSTTSTATGAGSAGTTLESTGSVTTTDVGVMMFVASESDAAADLTRNHSDVLVFEVNTGSSTYTGIIQYKIINASPNTLTDTITSEADTWILAYALYKST